LAYIGSNAYEIYQIDRFFLQHEFGALVSFVKSHEALQKHEATRVIAAK